MAHPRSALRHPNGAAPALPAAPTSDHLDSVSCPAPRPRAGRIWCGYRRAGWGGLPHRL